MTIRADITRSITPSRTRRGWYGSEVWEVWDSADGTATGQVNELGVCDPNKFESVTALPQYGHDGPLTGTLYTDIRVTQVIANYSYLVLATYASFGLYTGGPRQLSGSEGIDPKITPIPIYQSFVPTGSTSIYYFDVFDPWERDVSIRREVRFVYGNAVTLIQNAIDDNNGKWYNIGSASSPRYGLLSGSCSSSFYDGQSYTRVSYAFKTMAAHPGVPIGHPRYQNAVAVPPINNLQGWHFQPSPGPNVAPIVRTIDFSDNASGGYPLPGF